MKKMTTVMAGVMAVWIGLGCATVADPNLEELDADGDGTIDLIDALPSDPTETTDNDKDGKGDNADTDDDNDTCLDAADTFPLDPTECLDNDHDGVGDNADTDDDNDKVLDTADCGPKNDKATLDTDQDGSCDENDNDDDGDGFLDSVDAFPLAATESLDFDKDGVGDNADTDDDGDGVADTTDCASKNKDETADADKDGTCDVTDTDDDNDGYSDTLEATEGSNPNLASSKPVDTDGDGAINSADTDDDNDGYSDTLEATEGSNPNLASSKPVDTDGDGSINSADTDDDNDGVADTSDAFPTNATESVDNDVDGVGNNSDAFPNDKTEWTDADSDGVGNNADCNDSNAAVRPTAVEVCDDSINNNCDSTDDSLGCFILVDVAVAGDTFTMGGTDAAADPPNDTTRAVTINADYYIHKHEVTNTLYKRCVTAGTCTAPSPTIYYSDSSRGNQPVVNVTWNDANTYCTYINAALPTEAQWELAARGTGNRTYPWGAAAPTSALANYNSSEFVGDLVDVDQQSTGQTTLGIFQLAGNAFEWVADWSAAYTAGAATNPTGPTSGTEKIYRGGSFQSAAGDLEAADRFDASQTSKATSLGFRCADS